MPNQIESTHPAKRFQANLAKRFLIRFHMSLILAAVMAAAVLCSKLLLHLGVHNLPVRYPLAAVAAYLVFLGLVRIWVAYVTRSRNHSSESDTGLDDVDIGDFDLGAVGSGDAGGGGASGGFDTARVSGSSSSMPDFSLDFDEGGWILIVLGLLIAVIFGAGAYLIYIAPEVLPEVALQVVMASTLKRASNKLEQGNWAVSILKGTILPFLCVFVLTIGLGIVAQSTCPEATKLAEAMNCPVH